jgi:DNA-binding transcriptional regulator YiaG
MVRKPGKNDQRANEAIGVVLETLQSITTAKTENDALEAVKSMFERIPDVMANPMVQQFFAMGVSKGQSDSIDTMTKEELVLLRRWSKVTQVQLAAHLGLSQGFVSDMEVGKAPIPAKYVPEIRRFLDSRKPKKENTA